MRLKTITLLLATFVSINLISTLGVTFSAYQTIEINATNTISQRFKVITMLRERFNSIYLQELFPLTNDCSAFVKKSQKITFYEPYIRALSLSSKNTLICDSIYGKRNVAVKNIPLNASSVVFFPHSVIDPTSPVIDFNLNVNKDTTISYGINLSSIQDILLSLDYLYQVRVHIHDYEITSKKYIKLSSDSINKMTNHSIDMDGYKVNYKITIDKFIAFLITNYITIIFILMLLSFPITFLIYMGSKRIDLFKRKIAKAVRKKEFEPYFQPIFNKNKQIIGAEVLARWPCKKGFVTSPDVFISEAEKNGQIQAIFSLLVEKTITMLHIANKLPCDQFHLGFNISAPQISIPEFIDDCLRLASVLSQYNGILILELTERIHLPSNEQLHTTFSLLRRQGIRLALDDFGTGYSSLLYFAKLKFDILKIDKTFVDMIDSENDHQLLLNNVISLGTQLGTKITAEGIETAYQYRYLQRANVDYYQGYYFEKPITAKKFMAIYFNN